MKSKFSIEFQEFVYYALLAFVLLLTQNLLLQPKLDLLLSLALACFAVSIPFLITSLMVLFFKRYKQPDFTDDWYSKWEKHLPKALFLSMGAGIFGICTVFIHANTFIGILFLLAIVACLLILNKLSKPK